MVSVAPLRVPFPGLPQTAGGSALLASRWMMLGAGRPEEGGRRSEFAVLMATLCAPAPGAGVPGVVPRGPRGQPRETEHWTIRYVHPVWP